VTGGDLGVVRIWDSKNLKLLSELVGHTDWINWVEFSPNGLYIVSGSSDSTLKIWDVKNRTLIITLTSSMLYTIPLT
jgi:WD40 repeat protein